MRKILAEETDSKLKNTNYKTKLIKVQVGPEIHQEFYIGLPKDHPFVIGKTKSTNTFDHRNIFSHIIEQEVRELFPLTHLNFYEQYVSKSHILQQIEAHNIKPGNCLTIDNFYLGNDYEYLDKSLYWYSANLCTNYFSNTDCYDDAIKLTLMLDKLFFKYKDTNVNSYTNKDIVFTKLKKQYPLGLQFDKQIFNYDDIYYNICTSNRTDINKGKIDIFEYGYDNGIMEWSIVLTNEDNKQKFTNWIYNPKSNKLKRLSSFLNFNNELTKTYTDALLLKLEFFPLNKNERNNLRSIIENKKEKNE